MDGQNKTYRSLLKAELAARMRRNPLYSQRAFARDIGILPHRLSEVLSQKQGLSRKAAESIGRALGYRDAEHAVFCDLVDAEHARSNTLKEAARRRLSTREVSLSSIEQDVFKAICDWVHLASLETLNVFPEGVTSQEMSRFLNVNRQVVDDALERMRSLGLVTEVEGRASGGSAKESRWRGTGDHAVPSSDVPSAAIREFHDQVIALGKESVWAQPPSKRELASSFVSINRRNLPKFKARLRKLFDEFCDEADAEEKIGRDAVYAVSMQFFKIGECNDYDD